MLTATGLREVLSLFTCEGHLIDSVNGIELLAPSDGLITYAAARPTYGLYSAVLNLVGRGTQHAGYTATRKYLEYSDNPKFSGNNPGPVLATLWVKNVTNACANPAFLQQTVLFEVTSQYASGQYLIGAFIRRFNDDLSNHPRGSIEIRRYIMVTGDDPPGGLSSGVLYIDPPVKDGVGATVIDSSSTGKGWTFVTLEFSPEMFAGRPYLSSTEPPTVEQYKPTLTGLGGSASVMFLSVDGWAGINDVVSQYQSKVTSLGLPDTYVPASYTGINPLFTVEDLKIILNPIAADYTVPLKGEAEYILPTAGGNTTTSSVSAPRKVLSFFSFEGQLSDSVTQQSIPSTELITYGNSRPEFGTYSAECHLGGRNGEYENFSKPPLDITKWGTAGSGLFPVGSILVSFWINTRLIEGASLALDLRFQRTLLFEFVSEPTELGSYVFGAVLDYVPTEASALGGYYEIRRFYGNHSSGSTSKFIFIDRPDLYGGTTNELLFQGGGWKFITLDFAPGLMTNLYKVSEEPTASPFEYRSPGMRILRSSYTYSERSTYTNFELVIFGIEDLKVIHNPVDSDYFTPTAGGFVNQTPAVVEYYDASTTEVGDFSRVLLQSSLQSLPLMDVTSRSKITYTGVTWDAAVRRYSPKATIATLPSTGTTSAVVFDFVDPYILNERNYGDPEPNGLSAEFWVKVPAASTEPIALFALNYAKANVQGILDVTLYGRKLFFNAIPSQTVGGVYTSLVYTDLGWTSSNEFPINTWVHVKLDTYLYDEDPEAYNDWERYSRVLVVYVGGVRWPLYETTQVYPTTAHDPFSTYYDNAANQRLRCLLLRRYSDTFLLSANKVSFTAHYDSIRITDAPVLMPEHRVPSTKFYVGSYKFTKSGSKTLKLTGNHVVHINAVTHTDVAATGLWALKGLCDVTGEGKIRKVCAGTITLSSSSNKTFRVGFATLNFIAPSENGSMYFVDGFILVNKTSSGSLQLSGASTKSYIVSKTCTAAMGFAGTSTVTHIRPISKTCDGLLKLSGSSKTFFAVAEGLIDVSVIMLGRMRLATLGRTTATFIEAPPAITVDTILSGSMEFSAKTSVSISISNRGYFSGAAVGLLSLGSLGTVTFTPYVKDPDALNADFPTWGLETVAVGDSYLSRTLPIFAFQADLQYVVPVVFDMVFEDQVPAFIGEIDLYDSSDEGLLQKLPVFALETFVSEHVDISAEPKVLAPVLDCGWRISGSGLVVEADIPEFSFDSEFDALVRTPWNLDAPLWDGPWGSFDLDAAIITQADQVNMECDELVPDLLIVSDFTSGWLMESDTPRFVLSAYDTPVLSSDLVFRAPVLQSSIDGDWYCDAEVPVFEVESAGYSFYASSSMPTILLSAELATTRGWMLDSDSIHMDFEAQLYSGGFGGGVIPMFTTSARIIENEVFSLESKIKAPKLAASWSSFYLDAVFEFATARRRENPYL